MINGLFLYPLRATATRRTSGIAPKKDTNHVGGARQGINSGYQGHATLTLGSTLWRTRVRHEKAANTRFQEAHISQPARMRQEISSTDSDAAVRARDELRYQLLEKQRDAMQRVCVPAPHRAKSIGLQAWVETSAPSSC